MSAKIEVELQEHMGSDASIANAAWTSTYDHARREEKYDDPVKVEDIVRRCVRDGHSVPLESVVLRFWMRVPVFVDRQQMTHRMASHNGLSGRYRTLPSDFLAMPFDVLQIMQRAEDVVYCATFEQPEKQYMELLEAQHQQYTNWLDGLRKARAAEVISIDEYKRAREVLRGVLGTAFMTERTTIMNLVSFANYQRLRNSCHAQPEIRRVAKLMLHAVIANGVAPAAIDELMKAGWRTGAENTAKADEFLETCVEAKNG